MFRQRGKNIIFRRGGGGINIVFGPKYRPLIKSQLFRELQNVELQNVELQTAEFQNIELQNAELQNAELQNVESYRMVNLTECWNTKRRILQNVEIQNVEIQNVENTIKAWFRYKVREIC